MTDQVSVRVVFSEDTQYGTFTDAIFIPFADYPLSDEALSALKQARVDAWIAVITAPGTPCKDCPEADASIPEGNG